MSLGNFITTVESGNVKGDIFAIKFKTIMRCQKLAKVAEIRKTVYKFQISHVSKFNCFQISQSSGRQVYELTISKHPKGRLDPPVSV